MGRFIFTDCLVHWGRLAALRCFILIPTCFSPNILVCNNSRLNILRRNKHKKKIPMDHSYHLLSNLLIFGFKEPHVYLYRPSTEPQIPQRSVDLVNKANAEFQELPFSHAAIAALYLSFTGDCQVGRWVSLPHGENKEFMTRKCSLPTISFQGRCFFCRGSIQYIFIYIYTLEVQPPFFIGWSTGTTILLMVVDLCKLIFSGQFLAAILQKRAPSNTPKTKSQTSNEITSNCAVVVAKIASAMVHWTHFSQALIAAATVTAVCCTETADICAKKKIAACHSPPGFNSKF